MHELKSLQNAANDLGLVICQKLYNDKRRTTPMFFAQDGNKTISPVLDYEQMNHFLLGYRAAKKTNK